MADLFSADVFAGGSSLSVPIFLRSNTTGEGLTAKVAADLTATYWRIGESPTSISLSDLATITTAYASGGVKEVNSTTFPGLYRLDLPNAMFTAGPAWAFLSVQCSGAFPFFERLALGTAPGARVLTEGYAADGAAPTEDQMLSMLWSMAQAARSGTTLTTFKLDGVTVAMTFTLNSATAPTQITRTA
jgi:hypothetical protein